MEYNHKYDPYGMPVSFVQTLDSSVWRELMVYDASGWRVASLAYENDSLRAIRTDIMVGGKKVLERRRSYIASDSSVAEHRMIQGKSGIVGRILPDSSKEWYIKDYQGSLVMTLVDNGTGNVFAYEPYGAQQKIQVSGESPAEQYTGKELNERVGLSYYGARFFDPVFGIWMTPDPTRQYMNLYAFGGDPVNKIDRDGRKLSFSLKGAISLVSELASGGAVSFGTSSLGMGAGLTADALTGGAVSGALGLGLAAQSMPATPVALGSSIIRGENKFDNLNSFITGMYIDAAGGVGPAAGLMTTGSYIQRCYYGDCGSVMSDAAFGGFFADDVGHMLGLANVKYMGGTADWYDLGGVSEYYRGNTVYSGGFMEGQSGGFSHFGHATFVPDRKEKGTIAHEINHSYQMEAYGNRFGYYDNYLEQNSWGLTSESPTYYTNSLEMDAYFMGYLRNKGYVNVYGEGLEDASEDDIQEWSSDFYNNYKNKEDGKYREAIEAKFGKEWVWHKDWWMEY